MHLAPAVTAAQTPTHLLAGVTGLTQRLSDLGIAVQYAADIPRDDVGELDMEARILWVASDAPREDQVWLLQQAWNWLAIGPHACPTAKVAPRLQLLLPLPLPRSPRESAS